jgi:ABC-2 type transport system ATP-binding protein
MELVYRYDCGDGDECQESAIADLLRDLAGAGIGFADLRTAQRSLEEIFVSLVSAREPAATEEGR